MDLFDGVTYEAKHDELRLTGQLGDVYEVMKDGGWYTLEDIQGLAATNTRAAGEKKWHSQAGISARIRDFRKEKFGGYSVERRRTRHPGLWEYRLVLKGEE